MELEESTVLGNKLKKLRNALKMTQDDIAMILGMSRTSFSKYENGAINPPLNVMRKLAAIYGVGLDYLIYDDETSIILNDVKADKDKNINDSSITFGDLNYEEKMLILKMRLMSEEEKKEIKEIIEDN